MKIIENFVIIFFELTISWMIFTFFPIFNDFSWPQNKRLKKQTRFLFWFELLFNSVVVVVVHVLTKKQPFFLFFFFFLFWLKNKKIDRIEINRKNFKKGNCFHTQTNTQTHYRFNFLWQSFSKTSVFFSKFRLFFENFESFYSTFFHQLSKSQ